MIVNAATQRALDLIAQRAADARAAFTPGALPHFGDTTTAAPKTRLAFDPLSVSAPANDYFLLGNDRGQAAYTRDGVFELHNGVLCTRDGFHVRGFARAGAATSDLRVDPVDAALGRVSNLRIERDGTLAYDRSSVDPRTGVPQSQRVVAGVLALARFPLAARMQPSDDGAVSAPPGVVPHVGRAGDGNFGDLEPMHRDESRIDLNRSLEKLHDAYLAFDALLAAHRAQGHTGKVAMDLLK